MIRMNKMDFLAGTNGKKNGEGKNIGMVLLLNTRYKNCSKYRLAWSWMLF
jgi:hypothetical protein